MNFLQGVLDSVQSQVTDAFWSSATSLPVLLVLGAVVLAGALARLVPTAVFPQLAAWVALARVAGTLAAFAIAFAVGYRVSDQRDAMKTLQRDLAFSQNQLAQQRASSAEKELLAAASLANADALKSQVDDYVSKAASTPARAACTLNDDDRRGLLNIKPRRARKAVGADPAGLRRFGFRRSTS